MICGNISRLEIDFTCPNCGRKNVKMEVNLKFDIHSVNDNKYYVVKCWDCQEEIYLKAY